MKTICLLESVSRADGGIFEAESALQRNLCLYEGVQVQVVGLEDQYSLVDAPRWSPLVPKTLSVTGPTSLGYSAGFAEVLDQDADLLYAATLWRYPSWASLQWRQKSGKPLIVAPHGSLDGWALKHSYWRKRIAARLFKDAQLHAASCLRALSMEEANSFRAYGLKNPICVIPNGVRLPEENQNSEVRSQKSYLGKKTLLFLGRIHPKKGLANALIAFKKTLDSRRPTIDSSSWQFVIAGWDQGGHESELKKLCNKLSLSWNERKNDEPVSSQLSDLDPLVIFHGPAFGEEKKQLFQLADAFVLPSFSEGLPMAVLEAWAHSLPVIMTPECNLTEGFKAAAAIRITTNINSITKGLWELFFMSDEDRWLMGSRGRKLVELQFAGKVVARKMRTVYEWILGGGMAPDCVIR